VTVKDAPRLGREQPDRAVLCRRVEEPASRVVTIHGPPVHNRLFGGLVNLRLSGSRRGGGPIRRDAAIGDIPRLPSAERMFTAHRFTAIAIGRLRAPQSLFFARSSAGRSGDPARRTTRTAASCRPLHLLSPPWAKRFGCLLVSARWRTGIARCFLPGRNSTSHGPQSPALADFLNLLGRA